LDYFYNSFPYYNRAIISVINQQGFDVPNRNRYVVGFVDAKKVKICRPSGRNMYQRSMYDGHKKIHCFKVQTLVSPDGMFMDLSTPHKGKDHDSLILANSRLNQRMSDLQLRNPIQYTYYTDKGYPITTSHGRGAFREGRYFLPHQQLDNSSMVLVRVMGSECGFAKPCMFRLTDYHKNMKIRLSSVTKYYFVSCLLSNAHTCFYGNEISKKFNTSPPDFDEYFNV
jgi:hypothetical protein